MKNQLDRGNSPITWITEFAVHRNNLMFDPVQKPFSTNRCESSRIGWPLVYSYHLVPCKSPIHVHRHLILHLGFNLHCFSDQRKTKKVLTWALLITSLENHGKHKTDCWVSMSLVWAGYPRFQLSHFAKQAGLLSLLNISHRLDFLELGSTDCGA